MIDAFGTWRPDFPGQNPYQDPAFIRMYGQPQTQPQETRMEVVPVKNEAEVDKLYVAAGTGKLAMAENDTFLAVKTVSMSGQTSTVYFDRRPEPPQTPAFVPGEYVRKDEIKELVQAVLAAREGKEQ